MAVELLDFQKDGVDFIKKTRYCILAFSPGMGKTITSMEASIQMGAKRILVVVPSYLIFNWVKEIKKFWPHLGVTAFTQRKNICTPFDVEVAIVAYSSLKDARELFEWAQIAIFDEAQYLKNMSSQRGDFAHALVYENSVPRVIMLSGTIVENRIYELHSPLTIMHYNPKETDTSFLDEYPTYVEFANEFSHLKEFDMDVGKKRIKVKNWTGIKNKPKLIKILKKFMLVKKFDDHIKLDAPLEVPIYASDIDQPELLEDFEKFVESNGESANSKAKAKSALAKVKITSEYVKTSLHGNAVVVFTDHIESAKELGRLLDCPYVDGSMPVDKRQDLADRFNNLEFDTLVATIGSFSTGINLHHRCNQIVLNDIPWKPSSIEQVYGRIRRVGQDKQCVYHLIFMSPQDEKIYKLVKEKSKIIKEVT